MQLVNRKSARLSISEWQSKVKARFPKAKFIQEDGSGRTYGDVGEWTAAIGPDMQSDVVGVYTETFCSIHGLLPDDVGDEYMVISNTMLINAASRLKTDEIIKTLAKKVSELSRDVSEIKSQSNNPSVVPTYHKMIGKLQALESVISFMKSGRSIEIDNL